MKSKSIFILFIQLSVGLTLILSHSFKAKAQSNPMLGLWGVDLVTVGDRDVTPTAKWFRFREDMSCEAGNGWTQNLIGTYTYSDGTFKPTNKNQPLDPFGPFKVTFTDDNMFWEREEEGMRVKVTLSPINKFPAAPADQVIGLWDLQIVKQKGKDITASYDPKGLQYLNVRWTRQYDVRLADGSQTRGFWHMDAHDPRLSLVNYDKEVPVEQYMIYTVGDSLIMESLDKQTVMTYQRILERPS
ncbi:hypothetical protein [Reichenbachiella ulvae]|uniref:Lipocalin-like domain-containing protein n=1 Tax=Reichenbachiella ulvae TaxID=2980104 RepID=A0ABT3CPN9_9BACT|nr:hypothetical protein [Reichenbachiella ulvae]MCV9385675.1 hypothetical protein [Reichenbachiella ulvae]